MRTVDAIVCAYSIAAAKSGTVSAASPTSRANAATSSRFHARLAGAVGAIVSTKRDTTRLSAYIISRQSLSPSTQRIATIGVGGLTATTVSASTTEPAG